MRGIRGAITVGRNEKEEIWQAAQELVTEILRTNNITPADIGAAIFSVTEDLRGGRAPHLRIRPRPPL